MTMPLIKTRIERIKLEADGIRSFIIVDRAGQTLPTYSPGSHLDVHTPSSKIRQYSLCNVYTDGASYEIAVQCEMAGDGGSYSMHEQLSVGDELHVSVPRNNFPLADHAGYHLLLAGGIGITPILCMARHLENSGGAYELHYCCRTVTKLAFRDVLHMLEPQGGVHSHLDDGSEDQNLDLGKLLSTRPNGAHVNVCGPNGFMEAARTAAEAWPADTFHVEYFSTDANLKGSDLDLPFRIRLAQSGREFEVPANKSIIEVLRKNNMDVETSCEQGVCGTCITDVLEGRPDHRDMVLTPDEQKSGSKMALCVSRSLSDLLILDR